MYLSLKLFNKKYTFSEKFPYKRSLWFYMEKVIYLEDNFTFMNFPRHYFVHYQVPTFSIRCDTLHCEHIFLYTGMYGSDYSSNKQSVFMDQRICENQVVVVVINVHSINYLLSKLYMNESPC